MSFCNFNTASEEYADFIARHSNLVPERIRETLHVDCLDYIDSEFSIVYAPLTGVLPITVAKYTYSAIPNLYTLLDTTSMEASGILKTFQQPTLGLRGEGVIIGFIDTGIDYGNPLFRYADGTSRILSIWDQTLPQPLGTTREPYGIPSPDFALNFTYGQEFIKSQIDMALASDDPLSIVPSTDTIGHGTFLAGIAAGGTSANEDFVGAAPDSFISVVKLKPAKQYLRGYYLLEEEALAYQENDIMLGIKYLEQLAYQQQRPLVICLGLGTNYGSHEGSSPLGLVLGSLNRVVGICTVIAAGNETGMRHHYLGRIAQKQEYEDVEIRAAPGERGFILELWSTEPELYTVGFVSPTGETISRLPISLGAEIKVPFVLEKTSITVNYRTAEVGSGSQFIVMRFDAPTAGIWHVRVYNFLFITGIFHMWLPITGFSKPDTAFLKPDPDTTITEPANAATPITISTYNHHNDSIYIHSSRGYARNRLIKPDLAAPGVDVYGPGIAAPANPGYFPMTTKTGSSIAAAHVAGAVANLFTWGIVRGNNVYLSDASVRAYLIRGANRNPAYTYPNREFGYGTLDLYQTFLRTRE